MKIKQILSQNRRDFRADYECEGCGYIEKNAHGYDDAYFHSYFIPIRKCPQCSKSSVDLGVDYRPLAPKYPEGMQV